jgi:hypothetical protein
MSELKPRPQSQPRSVPVSEQAISKSKLTLSERIAAALVDDIQSPTLAGLIEEVQIAAREAAAAADQAQARALDPTVVDPAARSAMEECEHVSRRLQAALPQLQKRHRIVRGDEQQKKWHDEYNTLKVERDALASELAELYPPFEAKITDLFARMAANDAALSRLHQAAPDGVFMRLLNAELVARNLENFSREAQPIVKELRLPSFAPGQPLAWPPPQRIDPAKRW